MTLPNQPQYYPGYPGQPQPTPAAPQPQPTPAAPQPQPTPAAPQPQPGYPTQPQPGYPTQPQPGYPTQPQPGYPAQPQPGYPAQASPGYPAQQPVPAAPQPQPGYPPQQPAPAPQPQPTGPPTLHHIDHAAMMADYKDQQSRMPTSGLSGWFEMPGPNGLPRWDKTVPPGYEASALFHVCGPWAPGKKLYVPRPTHFWKSYAFPKGTSVVCGCYLGKDRCRICKRVAQLQEHADASMQKRLRESGKVRWKFLYNVVWLQNLEAHRIEDGSFAALKLEAVKGVHDKLIQIFNGAGGAMSVCDYQNGWPIVVMKKKTGPEVMNVDWDAMPDMGGRRPLPQEFWPIANRLTDLEQLITLPTDEEAERALNDMGLGGIVGGGVQVPQGYPPGPVPPNPYQPQMPGVPQAAFGGPGFPPQQAFSGPSPVPTPQPPMPAGTYAPDGQPASQPQPEILDAQGRPWPQQPAPEQAAPPQMAPPPVGQPPGPGVGGPPEMAPPPVTSQPTKGGYTPQPGYPGVVSEGQPMPMGDIPQLPVPIADIPPPSAEYVDSPRPLQVPLPPGTQLSEGRERCFGMHNETDRACQECPDWIKRQCLPVSGKEVAPVNDPALAELQKQAAGK